MPYTRPWKSRAEQIALLQARGLEISDPVTADECLAKIGYYRLSGYWYSFRERDASGNVTNQFKVGARFSDAVDLYVFDKKLRILALDALERIEVAVRVEIAHLLGQRDTFAQHNTALLDGRFTQSQGRTTSGFQNWQNRYSKALNRSSETFIDHYRQRHGLPLPIWVSIEIWDFGLMSFFYSGMKGVDRNTIAHHLNLPDGRYLKSWIRTLNYLRNVCAHHSRLWNRNMVEQPSIPTQPAFAEFQVFNNDPQLLARPFSLFCLLQWLMKEICPRSNWHIRFKEHLASFPLEATGSCSLSQMGCPTNWEGWALWS